MQRLLCISLDAICHHCLSLRLPLKDSVMSALGSSVISTSSYHFLVGRPTDDVSMFLQTSLERSSLPKHLFDAHLLQPLRRPLPDLVLTDNSIPKLLSLNPYSNMSHLRLRLQYRYLKPRQPSSLPQLYAPSTPRAMRLHLYKFLHEVRPR